MKIGILTHHYVKNYGAFLQMKGMYEALCEIYPEADIKIIDFVVGKHWRKNILHVLHYRKGVDTLYTYVKKIKQLRTFTKYEHSIPKTEKVRSADEINKLEFDLIVLGSDEIWNFHASGYSPLKYGTGLKAKRIISYAASVGAVTEDSTIPQNVIDGLKSLKSISGRDIETLKFVKRSIGRDAFKMLDPTFLYNFDIEIDKENISRQPYDYILIYDCKLTNEQIKDLKEYAGRNKLKILGAGDYKVFYDEVTVNLTPYEWVNLFRNATKIITGTFHGTVFSIKYYKDFVCYPTEKNRINKISSLLNDMGLFDRLIQIEDENKLIGVLSSKTDYVYARKYIAEKKREAFEFIRGE